MQSLLAYIVCSLEAIACVNSSESLKISASSSLSAHHFPSLLIASFPTHTFSPFSLYNKQ